MQPNGNMPGAGRPVAGAPVNNVNVKPTQVSAPAPAPAPKPAEPAFGNGGSVVEGKGSKKTGWILAIVLLLLIAAGGVGMLADAGLGPVPVFHHLAHGGGNTAGIAVVVGPVIVA